MTKQKKKQPLGQTIGGVLFGFEQAVLRTMPPAQELVRQARPDDPVPAGDGGLLKIELPADGEPVLPSATGPDPVPASGSGLPDPARERNAGEP